MRYEDWDILLFPRDCKVPVKEFKVACHIVHDPDISQLSPMFGLPTVCCFIPSLVTGTPFQVSIHSWNTPSVSEITNAYTRFPEDVKFQARLFLDGRIVASTIWDNKSNLPHIITHSVDFSKAGDLETLKFPSFRQELLQQNYWSPADDLGRIKIVLSEGFPRDSVTMPFERVKNIVAFSFQHAPLDILESSSIAWPNPSMWHRAPFATSMQVPTLQSIDADAHAHSPQRRDDVLETLGNSVNFGQRTTPSVPIPASSRRVTHPVCGSLAHPAATTSEIFGDAGSYFEWLSDMGAGAGDAQRGNSMHNIMNPRTTRKSSTDISMPDYIPLKPNNQCLDSQAFASDVSQEEDKGMLLKVPTNTPTTVGISNCNRDGNAFPIITRHGSFPSDLAESLTNSLLNQPMPMHIQYSSSQTPRMEVKSRKENCGQLHHCGPSPTMTRATSIPGPEHQELRQVSQHMYIPSGSSMPIGIINTKQSNSSAHGRSETSPSSVAVGPRAACDGRMTLAQVQDETIKSSGDKGTKRIRNFTAASARVIDEADQPRRASPRVHLAPFTDDQVGITDSK